jgi:hypothetical protein
MGETFDFAQTGTFACTPGSGTASGVGDGTCPPTYRCSQMRAASEGSTGFPLRGVPAREVPGRPA